MLSPIAARLINHMLEGESWARKRLQPYTGKIVHIKVVAFFDSHLSIQNDGLIISVSDDLQADTTILLTPASLLTVIADDHTTFNDIEITGNKIFADELINICKNLHWDLEHDLSKTVGDIAAHRIVELGRKLLRWNTQSMHNLSQALAEYLIEEQPMLANRILVNEFNHEIDMLHDDTEHLEQRIQRLINQKINQ